MAVEIREMKPADLETARRICNLAFGTFLGHPEPEQFFGDMDHIGARFGAPNTRAFVAVEDGAVLGSNLATRWGSLGFFGPLTIHPEAWDKGLGKQLMAPVMDTFSEWQCTHRGLFTFPHSTKHVGLYRKYGFYPRYLTAVLAKPPNGATETPYLRWSDLNQTERASARKSIETLTHELLPGLSLADEIDTVFQRDLGETLLVGSANDVDAFMICHAGSDTEAGGGRCFGKFGAARKSEQPAETFKRLVQAVEAYARSEGLGHVMLGVNTARRKAYEALSDAGYRTVIQGIAMQSDNEPGTCTEEHYVVDDWR